jgi:uncharacterized membrane protein
MARTDPMERLKDTSQDFLKALGDRAVGTVTDKVSGLTDKFEDIAGGGPIGKAVAQGAEASAGGGSAIAGALKGAASGVKDKITGGGGGGESGGGKATKSTNIIETIDVGVPISVAYNQWTEFGAFPSFMKKVENVEAQEDNKIEFKAQIFLSHRSWQATILQQIPDERIVWRSKGQKGHVDGAVTFHELGPNLTRILVVLEYYPQGLFEKTGNIWEAQGRRARAELRHFRRHVMTRTILEPEEVEGWRGVIEDGEVVKTHEEVVEEEEQQSEEDAEGEEYEGDEGESEEDGGEADDEYEEAEDAEAVDEEEPEEEYSEEGEPEEGEPEEGEPEDEYAEEEYAEEEQPEEEYAEEGEPDEGEAEEPLDEEPESEDAEDEYPDEADEEEEEQEEQPRRRRRRAS